MVPDIVTDHHRELGNESKPKMGSARRRRFWKDRPLRQVAREHVYAILSQRRTPGWYDALVGTISGAAALPET